MEAKQLFEDFPENYPLYKDSGLWQLRSDCMEEVLVQQQGNESFEDFIIRIKQIDKEIIDNSI